MQGIDVHMMTDRESILIVDDSPANLRLLSQMLATHGYRVRAVTNGLRALESAAANPPTLILLDIRMQGMNGFEVCERLKNEPRTCAIPVIFISAVAEIADKVRAFQVGGVDYITKPFQIEEVLARIETHLSLRRLQAEMEEANRKFGRELALAGKVQMGFLPGELPQPACWQLAARLKPAHETSGDFYDVFELPGGSLALVMADVVDKGVGAALLMAMAWSLIRTYAIEHEGRPAQVCQAVNERLLQDAHADQFITVFYGELKPDLGSLVYSNAGHNPPLLFRQQDTESVEQLAACGPPLGIIEGQRWYEKRAMLEAGALLVLYTDGITEAENNRQDFFGMQRLVDAVEARRQEPAAAIRDGILADVQRFTQEATQTDDMALIVVRAEQENSQNTL